VQRCYRCHEGSKIYRTYGAPIFHARSQPMATALRSPWATDMARLRCRLHLRYLVEFIFCTHRYRACYLHKGNDKQNLSSLRGALPHAVFYDPFGQAMPAAQGLYSCQ